MEDKIRGHGQNKYFNDHIVLSRAPYVYIQLCVFALILGCSQVQRKYTGKGKELEGGKGHQ